MVIVGFSIPDKWMQIGTSLANAWTDKLKSKVGDGNLR